MDTQTSVSHSKHTVESRTLSVTIDRPCPTLYEFLVNPANWNQWAIDLQQQRL
jgi:hypothetical protein